MVTAGALVRLAVRDEWRELGDLVGTAFASDPLTAWTFGDPGLIRSAFRRLARDLYLPYGCGWFAGSLGGAMWLDPGPARGLALASSIALGLRLAAGGRPAAVLRALEIDASFRTRRPAAPHGYLFAVGLLPQARGKGLGRALLEPQLARLDQLQLPAWLENTNPANDAFYRALGFIAQETFRPATGSPPVTTMRREPRRPPTGYSHSIVAGGLPEMS